MKTLARSSARVAAVLLLAGPWLSAEQRVTQPYAGVASIDRTETAPRAVHMHIVQIDLEAPGLRFALSPQAGGREVVRQTTLELLKQPYPSTASGTRSTWTAAHRRRWCCRIRSRTRRRS